MVASTEELKQLTRQAGDDDVYWHKLEEDPAAATASLGITLTKEQVEVIKSRAMQAEEAGLQESKGLSVLTRNQQRTY